MSDNVVITDTAESIMIAELQRKLALARLEITMWKSLADRWKALYMLIARQ